MCKCYWLTMVSEQVNFREMHSVCLCFLLIFLKKYTSLLHMYCVKAYLYWGALIISQDALRFWFVNLRKYTDLLDIYDYKEKPKQSNIFVYDAVSLPLNIKYQKLVLTPDCAKSVIRSEKSDTFFQDTRFATPKNL